MATSKKGIATLISAYLEWCDLLDVKVVKVQLWSNRPGSNTLQVAGRTLETSPIFRILRCGLCKLRDYCHPPTHCPSLG